MTDLFLNANMMLSIWTDNLLTMGLPLIDESLAKLLKAMETAPTGTLQGIIVGWCRTIGSCIALGVGAYEAWMMILGRRGMDVMKILRIVILAFCISTPGMSAIKSMCDAPGKALESATKSMSIAKNADVAAKEKAVAKKQSEYIDSLRSVQAKQMEQKEASDALEESEEAQGGLWGKVKAAGKGVINNIGVIKSIKNLGTEIENQAKQAAALVETKVSELINDVIRFIGEVIFQLTYYGLLLGQRIFMNVLWMFMPVAFCMSLAPPFRNAWSQWLSKYLCISFWPFMVYLIVYYVDYLLIFYLEEDLTAYQKLLSSSDINTWSSIGALGIQAIGTTCMYVVGLLAGAKILSMVPEVASWLIPGGVSSGIGQMASQAATGAVAGTVGAAVGTTMVGTQMAGGAVQGASNGGGVTGAIQGIAANTQMGQAFTRGSQNTKNAQQVGKLQ